MAVIVLENGRMIFRPAGIVSESDIEQAEALHLLLKEELPHIAEETMRLGEHESVIAKWHYFGKEIAKIIDNPDLVPRSDVESGDIWLAIRQKLPENFGLKNAGLERDSSSPVDRNRDHLSVAYKLGQLDLEDVKWFKRWDDWTGIYYREALWDDKRILKALGEAICNLENYPSREFYRSLLKVLAEQFPNGRYTEELPVAEIKKRISDAVKEIRASGIKK